MTSKDDGLTSLLFIGVLAVICTLSVLSNVLVIVVTALKRTIKSCTDIFIINLAVSDLLLAGLALPLKLNNAAMSSYKHGFSGGNIGYKIVMSRPNPSIKVISCSSSTGNIGCKIIMSGPLLTITCSITTMVVMSFDRHVAIVYQKILTQMQAVLLVGLVWMISMAMTGPQIYEYSTYHKFDADDNETEVACGSHGIEENFELIYASCVVALCYFLPLALIIINYVRVVAFLKKVTRESSMGQSVTSVVSKATVNVLRMLITVTAVFALLWLPFFVLFTMEEITGTDDSTAAGGTSNVLKQLFVALSTTSNPVLYLIFSREYRHGLINILQCKNAVVPSNFSSHAPARSTTQVSYIDRDETVKN
ncbi:histamine H2 receptor-like [Gigantopelta aegis]|uniref:histamine H2 receptor-like n=1 Tax=Gigantopelta aegis TaxID=1735272 RepID=UPI001B88DDC4|nr:histamine H2 receptor-like [Gigantopelta aegis]